MSVSLFSATLAQIGLPPWQYGISQKPLCKDSDGYYSKEAYETRRRNREMATAYLQATGPCYIEDIARRLEINLKAARAVLAGMVKSKVAERLEDGRYQLTEAANA